jgi:hypothetical protein
MDAHIGGQTREARGERGCDVERSEWVTLTSAVLSGDSLKSAGTGMFEMRSPISCGDRPTGAEPSSDADVGGVSPVPVQMWER